MTREKNLEDLWHQKTSKGPSPEALATKARHLRKKHILRSVIIIPGGILTCIGLGVLWNYLDPRMMTTKIGLGAMMGAILIHLVAHTPLLSNLMRISKNRPVREHIQHLLKVKQRQIFLQTTMNHLYLFLLTVGVGLYMYEFLHSLEGIWMEAIYGGFLLYILFIWFHVRPKLTRKHTKELEDLIQALKGVEENLETPASEEEAGQDR